MSLNQEESGLAQGELPAEVNLRKVKLECGKQYDFIYFDKTSGAKSTREGEFDLVFDNIYKDKVTFRNSEGKKHTLYYDRNKDSDNVYIIVKPSPSPENIQRAREAFENETGPPAKDPHRENVSLDPINTNSSAIGAGAGASSSSGGRRRKTRKAMRRRR